MLVSIPVALRCTRNLAAVHPALTARSVNHASDGASTANLHVRNGSLTGHATDMTKPVANDPNPTSATEPFIQLQLSDDAETRGYQPVLTHANTRTGVIRVPGAATYP